MTVTLHQLLRTLVEQGGTDLHITTNSPPQIRIDGKLIPLQLPPLSAPETKQLCYSVLTDNQKHRFEETLELDLSFGVKGLARFRANVYSQRGAIAGAFRTIPWEIKSFKDLGLPDVVSKLCDKPRGLVLVTGPTGSGKSTTLAAMLDKVNAEGHEHIVTIEDPVEFLHQNKKSVLSHREVGSHTRGFTPALRTAIRQDADVVLVGEMRDRETIALAITAAEMGMLVFATLHTNGATKTVDRIVDAFPADEQNQVRVSLSESLAGVVSQLLLPTADGKGRCAVFEILLKTPGLPNIIREGNTPLLNSLIQSGRHQGMQSMDDALFELAKSGAVLPADAFSKAMDKPRFAPLLS